MRVKNWSKFQHFKDRKPPWVKLYRDILDDMQWHKLDGQSAKVLTMLWLIASEDDGNLPDIATLAFRLRMTEREVSTCCSNLSHWLEQTDITTISERYQDDPPERETEREEETEKEKKAPRKREAPFAVPDWINREHWDAWHSCGKRKNCTNAQKQMAVDKLDSWRQQGIDHAAALENAAIGGWQGLFKPDQPGKAGGGGEHKYAAAHKAIFGDFQ